MVPGEHGVSIAAIWKFVVRAGFVYNSQPIGGLTLFMCLLEPSILVESQDVKADFAGSNQTRAAREPDGSEEREQATIIRRPKANITRKTFYASPLAQSQTSPGHSAQVNKIFF